MIKKQFLKSKPVCKVTFTLTAEAATDAKNVELVGDFSKWSESPIKMKKTKSGEFKTTVDLAKGQNYEFRYLIDGKKWANDWEADAYVPNKMTFEENSVVSL
ncbi:glycoside hydrolase [Cryomorpha ignava]|uniref:Glycoside hydrolase n=1 Tax=Cryomorpha ignava TaxID=101383 RepID=A0A7K3WWF9_9FLAO|nr:isoamylase early set domain-containing protein [Cryomorpha ignava]NEN24945.1 glycoside hydrolase [Cryomorpha ignava]